MAVIDDGSKFVNGKWVSSATSAPMLPPYLMPGPGTDTLSGVNRANIAALFDPNFGRTEQITAGAENAIAGGWGQGGFGQNQTNRLLDSERKQNFVLGSQLLEPYLQRENQAAMQASDQAARLNQIAAEGAQALQRLQLSEAGQGARLSQELAARLEQQAIEGQQALQQLTLREAGDTGRNEASIQGQLANTLLSNELQDRRGNGAPPVNLPSAIIGSSPTGAPIYDQSIQNAQNKFIAGMGQQATGGGSYGLGSTSIDQLLRKYGLI